MSRVLVPLRAIADVFENPDLGRLQIAWAGMAFAMWAFAITLGVYAFEVGGATAVGIAGLVRLFPGALASPFGGLLGDRHDRRSVLLFSSLAAAVAVAGAAAAVVADAPPWVVFAMAGLFTVAGCPYVPAESALMPQLARTPQELSAANVAHSAMDNLGFLGGSLIGGVLLATTSIQVVFVVAALAALASTGSILTMARDRRPRYAGPNVFGGVLQQTFEGFRAIASDAPMRLVCTCLTLLVFVEGAADVLVVILALELLGLDEASVAYLNASWGVGALIAGAALAVLVSRGRLVAGLVIGSLLTGVAIAFPGVWPVAVAAYVGWFAVGIGYTFVEVAANTLLQRLGDDELLARVRGSLETARLVAMATGSIAIAVLVEMVGIRVATLSLAALLPLFALLRWKRLRSFEIGAPVAERRYALLRNDRIFSPLPMATVERLAHDLIEIDVEEGTELITQGETGDLFYLIESGRVEVLEDGVHRRFQQAGESFGEIALLRGDPRTATVRTVERTRFQALDRRHFIAAVTGHSRASEAADGVIAARLER